MSSGRVSKVKEADLYSAFIEVPYTQGAQVRSVTCKLHRTCLYLVSIHQMAHPRLRLRTSNCSHRHMVVNNLPRVALVSAASEIGTRDLLIASRAR